jgi:hypothetical protein
VARNKLKEQVKWAIEVIEVDGESAGYGVNIL